MSRPFVGARSRSIVRLGVSLGEGRAAGLRVGRLVEGAATRPSRPVMVVVDTREVGYVGQWQAKA